MGGDCNESFKNSQLTEWLEEKGEGPWLQDPQPEKNGEKAKEANR